MIPTLRAQLRSIIQERYGDCVVLPHGVQKDMATEFGVSHTLVYLAMKDAGRRSNRATRLIKLCGSCGAQISHRNQSGICRGCRKIPIACSNCGALCTRNAADLVNRIRRGKTYRTPDGTLAGYTGRVFCNRTCFGQWFGREHGAGAQHRKRALKEARAAL